MHLCFTARPEVLCFLSKMTDIKVDLLCCVLLPDQETLELHVQKDSRQSQAYHIDSISCSCRMFMKHTNRL